MLQPENNPAAAGLIVGAIREVSRGIQGQLGSALTPEATHDGRTLREWLGALREEIDLFLQ
jgi:hypothetical protein